LRFATQIVWYGSAKKYKVLKRCQCSKFVHKFVFEKKRAIAIS